MIPGMSVLLTPGILLDFVLYLSIIQTFQRLMFCYMHLGKIKKYVVNFLQNLRE